MLFVSMDSHWSSLKKLQFLYSSISELFFFLFFCFQLEKERYLMAELEKLQLELKPMEDIKAEIDRKSAQRTNIVVWGGLGYMAFQFGLLARLTWWEYSWDIMEPVTYFVGYGTAMACYAYFWLTRQVRNGPHRRCIHECLSNIPLLLPPPSPSHPKRC